MAFLVPHEGDVQLLTDLLGGGTLENWLLGLFHANITPSETDTAAAYTAQEATFTNYARKTLTRSIGAGAWNTPVVQAPGGSPAWTARAQVGHSQYGSTSQTWTCGATGDTIYGYFIIGATSGKLICAEAFAAPRTLVSGDSLSITPVFENA
ncbi:hypothetical protein [Aquisphaera insulae]|uniref:hypothetical protein n=1 Tax=Aquisphaera insulae TaxID=2712864 RepID=UPI0013EB34BE|nr:hypothetical protein [Aquisphaera insulae]